MIPLARGLSARQVAGKTAPFLVIPLAALAVRTPLATAYPFVSLLLFLWIVADTMMLSLLARSAGKPRPYLVVGVLAGACLTASLGAPLALRSELLHRPVLIAVMVAIIVAHLAWAAYRAGGTFRTKKSGARERWIAAASEILPPVLVKLTAAELTLLHMALFRWGGPADVPANCRAFAYHRHLAPIAVTLLILSAIEMAVYHLLVVRWNRSTAIIMFVLSDIGFIYLVGLIKSFRFRPVLLTPNSVCVRAGFLIEQSIPLHTISTIETSFAGESVRDEATLNAALLAWPNVLLRLDEPIACRSILKRGQTYNAVAFRLDNPEPFARLLRWRLGLS